jgi:hypothetical protein
MAWKHTVKEDIFVFKDEFRFWTGLLLSFCDSLEVFVLVLFLRFGIYHRQNVIYHSLKTVYTVSFKRFGQQGILITFLIGSVRHISHDRAETFLSTLWVICSVIIKVDDCFPLLQN